MSSTGHFTAREINDSTNQTHNVLLIQFLKSSMSELFFFLSFFLYRALKPNAERTSVVFNVSQTNEKPRYECSEWKKQKQFYGRRNGEK